jgi:hypothetical protein
VVPAKVSGEPIPISEMRVRYPYTLKYFSRYIDELINRGGEPYRSSLYRWRDIIRRDKYYIYKIMNTELQLEGLDKTPFYYIFNTKHVFSRYKVAWRYISRSFFTAVLDEIYDPVLRENKIVVPDCKLMYIPTDSYEEAHYISAILNSTPVRLLMKLIGVETQMSTHLLEYIRLDRYSDRDPLHKELSKLSMEAHRNNRKNDLDDIELEIDLKVLELYNIDKKILGTIKKYVEILNLK